MSTRQSHQANPAPPSNTRTADHAQPLGLRPAGPYDAFAKEPSEIVIGLVGPLGTDNDKVRRIITTRLSEYDYDTEIIQISKLVIPVLAGPERIPPDSPKYQRSKTLIDLGNLIRSESKDLGVLAVAAAAEIGRRRPNGKITRKAYLVTSLKLREEVAELRRIYGSGFYLFAIHTDRAQRIKTLRGPAGKEMTEAEAVQLITRDEYEPEPHGQHTRDTFALADFFCADEGNDDKLRNSIDRCLDLIFGNPTITPTFNEFAMFMAFAASLRSADLSRQVGAVIARQREILSTGANDCPRPGGGLYWPEFIGNRVDDSPRGRDYKRGYDSNDIEKERLINEILAHVDATQKDALRAILKKSSLDDITEYGRVVHAEMEALLACARSNISCRGATLYCTTFPCHNCAKHVIAAGIDEVIYVEPYPKSKALDFHDDAVIQDKSEDGGNKVRFKPFIGVGPRQFFDLFSMSLSSGSRLVRKNDDGTAIAWKPKESKPRLQLLPVDHRMFEKAAADYLSNIKPNNMEA